MTDDEWQQARTDGAREERARWEAVLRPQFLREQIARWLYENTAWSPYRWEEKSEQSRDEWREDADLFIAEVLRPGGAA